MAEEHVRGRMLLEENPGNRNPALPPQFDTTGKGDYRKVTPENPLPTANYVMSESGLWIPEPEVRDTQLSGSIVEKIDITEEVGIISAGGEARVVIHPPERTKYISMAIRSKTGRVSSAHLEYRNLQPPYGTPNNYVNFTAVGTLPSAVPVFEKAELLTDSHRIRIETDSGSDLEPYFVIIYLWRD